MIRSISLGLVLLFAVFSRLPGQETCRYDLSGNQYCWQARELKKLNAEGEVLFSWQNPSGGSISWVDPMNPFRILVYSDQTQQLIWLNNKLSPLGNAVLIADTDLIDPLGLCASKDGGMWVVDGGTSQLVKLDNNWKKQLEVPVRLGESAIDGNWIQMLEWKEYLAILLPDERLWIADLYGQILKRLTTDAKLLQFHPSGILIETGEGKKLYHPDNGQFTSLIKKP